MSATHDDRIQHELALQTLLWRMAHRSDHYRLQRIARERELTRAARRH